MLLGAHVSTAGGLPKAVDRGRDLGCEALQVFTRNQRQWQPKPLGDDEAAAFREAARAAGYAGRIVSHASYLINLCATDPGVLGRSKRAFVDEIERCTRLAIPYLCVHPGSHLGAGEEAGLAKIAAHVREALAQTEDVTVLLENTAGQGTNLGWRLEHLQELITAIDSPRVGVCIDTCHLFAAGYDLAGDYDGVSDQLAALGPIRAFHLNDSKHGCGARKDRHAHIGEGEIGRDAFGRLVTDERFAELPGLLETPDGQEGYAKNLATLRELAG